MAIALTSSTVTIEINGRDYEAHIGDPEVLQRMRKFAVELNRINFEAAVNIFEDISKRVREFTAAIFGEAATCEIFSDIQARDVIAEIQFFVDLNREINESQAMQSLNQTLGTYGFTA